MLPDAQPVGKVARPRQSAKGGKLQYTPSRGTQKTGPYNSSTPATHTPNIKRRRVVGSKPTPTTQNLSKGNQ